MELNVTPFAVSLMVQSVLLGISQLDFIGVTVGRVIVVALIVVNAALLFLFKNTSSKEALNNRLIAPLPPTPPDKPIL